MGELCFVSSEVELVVSMAEFFLDMVEGVVVAGGVSLEKASF